MEELNKDEDANRAREAREQGTTGMRTIPVVERVEVDVAETRPGDVSCLDEEGKARVEVRIDDEGKMRVERPGKM